MDLNRDLQACYGIGTGRMSVEWNGTTVVLPGFGGGIAWLTRDTVIYQRITDRAWIETCHLPTGEVTAVDQDGFNQMVAGGGTWAAFSNVGYRDSFKTRNSHWYPLAVDDHTGAIAIRFDRNSGTGLGVWDGTTLVPLGEGPDWQASFKEGILVYRQGPRWFSWPPGPTALPSFGNVLGCESSLHWGLGWQNERGLVAWPLTDPTQGILIASDEFNFSGRLRVDGGPSGADVLHVVTARFAGEQPGELRRYTIDTGTAPRVDLTRPPVVPIRMPIFYPPDHDLAVGIFGEPIGPQLTGYDEVTGLQWPVKPQTVGVFHTLGRGNFARSEQLAAILDVPLYGFDDSIDYDLDALPHGELVMLNTYARAGESAQAVGDRVQAVVGAILEDDPAARITFAVGASRQVRGDGTFNLDEQQVLDVAEGLWNFARSCSAVVAVWLWAWTRGDTDGILHTPSFQEMARRMRAASPHWDRFPRRYHPPIPPVHPPIPPIVEETSAMALMKADTCFTADQLKTHPGGGFYLLQRNGKILTIKQEDGSFADFGGQPGDAPLDQEQLFATNVKGVYLAPRYGQPSYAGNSYFVLVVEQK